MKKWYVFLIFALVAFIVKDFIITEIQIGHIWATLMGSLPVFFLIRSLELYVAEIK